MVKDMNAYPWSSHKAYLSVAKKWSWLHKKLVFDLLTKDKKSQLKTYRRFVAVEDDNELKEIMASKTWPSILGPKDFIDWVKATYQDIKGSGEMPQIRELYLDADSIISTVCDYYTTGSKELFASKRGTFNEPRCAAIYLIRRLRHDSLTEIGKLFNLGKYSSVSSTIGRMKARMKNDRKLNGRIKKIEDQLRKSQE